MFYRGKKFDPAFHIEHVGGRIVEQPTHYGKERKAKNKKPRKPRKFDAPEFIEFCLNCKAAKCSGSPGCVLLNDYYNQLKGDGNT